MLGAVDTQILCERVAGTERGFRLTTPKQKDMDDTSDYPFTPEVVEVGTDEDGDPITTCTVTCVEKLETEANKAKAEERANYVKSMILLLPQPGIGDWYKAAEESKALGEKTSISSAKNFVTRYLKEGPDFIKSNETGIGHKTRVVRGHHWSHLDGDPDGNDLLDSAAKRGVAMDSRPLHSSPPTEPWETPP